MLTGRGGGDGSDGSTPLVPTGAVVGFEGARGASGGGRNDKLLTASDGARVRVNDGNVGNRRARGGRRGRACEGERSAGLKGREETLHLCPQQVHLVTEVAVLLQDGLQSSGLLLSFFPIDDVHRGMR